MLQNLDLEINAKPGKIADTLVSSCWKALLPTATNRLATESIVPKNITKYNHVRLQMLDEREYM